MIFIDCLGYTSYIRSVCYFLGDAKSSLKFSCFNVLSVFSDILQSVKWWVDCLLEEAG